MNDDANDAADVDDERNEMRSCKEFMVESIPSFSWFPRLPALLAMLC